VCVSLAIEATVHQGAACIAGNFGKAFAFGLGPLSSSSTSAILVLIVFIVILCEKRSAIGSQKAVSAEDEVAERSIRLEQSSEVGDVHWQDMSVLAQGNICVPTCGGRSGSSFFCLRLIAIVIVIVTFLVFALENDLNAVESFLCIYTIVRRTIDTIFMRLIPTSKVDVTILLILCNTGAIRTFCRGMETYVVIFIFILG
jgi:hypothetical protein